MQSTLTIILDKITYAMRWTHAWWLVASWAIHDKLEQWEREIRGI